MKILIIFLFTVNFCIAETYTPYDSNGSRNWKNDSYTTLPAKLIFSTHV